jgi:hypothetical protein
MTMYSSPKFGDVVYIMLSTLPEDFSEAASVKYCCLAITEKEDSKTGMHFFDPFLTCFGREGEAGWEGEGYPFDREEIGKSFRCDVYVEGEYMGYRESGLQPSLLHAYFILYFKPEDLQKHKIIRVSKGSGESDVDINIYLVEGNLSESEGGETGLCNAVSCKNYCSGNTLYSGGTCNPETGKCAYSSKQCENGCDAGSARCIEIVENPEPEAILEKNDTYPVRVESISIDPNPAQAYGTHQITIRISDEYGRGPARFYVQTPEGVLSYQGITAGEGEPLEFESSEKTLVVEWEAPGRGLTQNEFEFAKEVGKVKAGYGISTGASLVGVVFPVVKKGETIYGMYGDWKNIYEQSGEFDESRSTKEKVYRGFDMGLSGVNIVVGGIEVGLSTTMVGGIASTLIEDYVSSTLDATQAYLKKEAAEERQGEMETRSMNTFVKVRVINSEGYPDGDYLAFVMEYLWGKEHAGGESW